MAKVKLNSPLATMTQGGAMIIGEKYSVRGAVAQQWGLLHGSQLRGKSITLEIPDNIREYDESRDIADQDTTRTGLIKATISAFDTDLNALDFVGAIADVTTKLANSRKASREARVDRTATPVAARPRTIVDPLDNTEEDGNVAADDDDDDAAALAALQAKADAKKAKADAKKK